MVRKNKAFEEKGAALGHNRPNDDDLIKHVEYIAKIDRQIDGLKEKRKDRLNVAKDQGHLKGGINKAVGLLLASAEKQQAKNEVQKEAERIFALCRDLPLFANAATEDEEEAA